MYGLFIFSRNVLANKLLKESKALQVRINRIKQDLEEYGAPQDIVQTGLGGMGIEGLLSSLNIDEKMLQSLGLPKWLLPIAQGYIAKLKTKGGDSEQKTLSGFI